MMLTTGIVGSGTPIANGLGLAAQLRGDDRVTGVSFGDGATSIGALHEALNLASLWNLPVIFVCHNNLWGECTPLDAYTKTARLAERASPFGIPGVTVDGTDVLEVYAAAAQAADRARAGDGPTFLEVVAPRILGHNFGDTGDYMDKAAVEQARANDPVPKFGEWLVAQGHLGRDELEAMRQQITDEVEQALAVAVNSDMLPTDELHTDVFAPASTRPVELRPTMTATQTAREMTFGEAINDALDFALGSDPRVFLLGEDIADPPGGVVRLTQGLSDQVRHPSGPGHADLRTGDRRGGHRRRARRAPPGRGDHADGLHDPGHGSARQPRRQAQVHVRTAPATCARRCVPGSGTAGAPSTAAAMRRGSCTRPASRSCVPATAADAKGLLLSCIADDDPCLLPRTHADGAQPPPQPGPRRATTACRSARPRSGRGDSTCPSSPTAR